MKRLLIALCTLAFIFFSNTIIAQEKVKDKADKSKMKDANLKVKDKPEKFKAKDDENKVKLKAENGQQPMTAMTAMDLPYTANYSSNFAIGNPAHSKMILELWKDWDDNAFDRHDYFADTMMMILPSGVVIRGKPAIMDSAKNFRGSLTSAKSTLDAWIPLRSLDRNEDWVALWGHEDDVYADGKTERREIHEIWRVNKDGKIDYMQQWSATPPPNN